MTDGPANRPPTFVGDCTHMGYTFHAAGIRVAGIGQMLFGLVFRLHTTNLATRY